MKIRSRAFVPLMKKYSGVGEYGSKESSARLHRTSAVQGSDATDAA
jgi:hypothetical protein